MLKFHANTFRVKSLFGIVVLLGLQFLVPAQGQSADKYQELAKGPFFWQEKKEVAEKMRSEAMVPVSATKSDGVWSFKGAGIVQAAKEFTFKTATDFERLKELKDHFSRVEISPDRTELKLGVRFLGKERQIEIKTYPHPEGNPSLLNFEVTEGLLKGLYGVLMVKDLGRQQGPESCEVGIVASFAGSTGWIPSFVFKMGVEGIMRHVAISLRNLVEKDYKNLRVKSGS